MSKTFIDKPLAKAPTVKESIKLASETAGEEFDLELLQTLSLFKKWSEDNPGKSYDDFLFEFGLKKIELSSGGVVESLEEEPGIPSLGLVTVIFSLFTLALVRRN